MKDVHKLLEDDLAYASTLNVICIKLFGQAYFNWEPEIIEEELRKITTHISRINLDKIQAISALVTTEQYYTFWETFENISNVLNMNDPQFETATPLSSVEICWSLVEANLNDQEGDIFSNEVLAYINKIFELEGLLEAPTVAKKYLSGDMAYRNKKFDTATGGQKKHFFDFNTEISQIVKFRVKQIKQQLTKIGIDL